MPRFATKNCVTVAFTSFDVTTRGKADPGGRAVQVVGLQLVDFWDCAFEFR
jgi:hypothetical protein